MRGCTACGFGAISCCANRNASNTFHLSNFIHNTVSAGDAAYLSEQLGVTVSAGDYAILVGMHVTSREILRWLRRARNAAELEGAGVPKCHPWIFPSRASKTGHLEDWRELPSVLSNVAHDLRRTYRSFANRRATKLEAKLLMNHALSDDVTDGYADPALLWPDLLAAQERISRRAALVGGAKDRPGTAGGIIGN